MRKIKWIVLVCCLLAILSGCSWTYPNFQSDEPTNVVWYPLDAANTALVETSGFFTFGTGILEWVGCKYEDVMLLLGDIYQSI